MIRSNRARVIVGSDSGPSLSTNKSANGTSSAFCQRKSSDSNMSFPGSSCRRT
jgi:hypothetical protein